MAEKSIITESPATKRDLEAQAKRLLRDAGALGILPTPLDVLVEAAGLECYKSLPDKEGFMSTLTEAGKKTFIQAMQALRGIADMREKAIYIPEGQRKTKERFAQAHEIIHQITPWHHINPVLLDTDETLSPKVKEQFEIEANYGAGELLFQGENFKKIARDYAAGMDSALMLADMHEASYQATLWKYAQVQDERICIIPYYSIKKHGVITGFRSWKGAASQSFIEKYSDIEIPQVIGVDHDWFVAASSGGPIYGQQQMNCGGQNVNFEWSAWSNTYTLFVMLRRRPALQMAGKIITKPKELIKIIK